MSSEEAPIKCLAAESPGVDSSLRTGEAEVSVSSSFDHLSCWNSSFSIFCIFLIQQYTGRMSGMRFSCERGGDISTSPSLVPTQSTSAM